MIQSLKPYLEIARFEFLVFTFAVASVPVSLSVFTGEFSPTNTAVATLLFLFLHIGVNSINVASDYRRGIDEDTEETPFSGGVDTLTAGKASYRTARNMGVVSVLASTVLFLWFVWLYGVFPMAALFVPGVVLVVGYTDLFARVGLGEASCGLGLGALPTVGIFYVQSGSVPQEILFLSVPMFLVCFNLLLLNAFPDIEADSKNGRKNFPILLGRRKAGYVYLVVVLATVASILAAVYLFGLPAGVLLALVPTVLVYDLFRRFLFGKDPTVTNKNLLYHTVWTIATPFFVSLGILVSALY